MTDYLTEVREAADIRALAQDLRIMAERLYELAKSQRTRRSLERWAAVLVEMARCIESLAVAETGAETPVKEKVK